MQSSERIVKNEILTKLIKSTGLLYSEVKPEGVDNDLYNYHLQHLIAKGLVVKVDRKYSLTLQGKRYVEEVQPLDPIGQTSELFRINVLAIVVKKNGRNKLILNQLRKRHPYYGDVGIIGGTVRKGELIADAAHRKVRVETGLLATFRHIGTVRKIRYTDEEQIFSDIFYHICFADKFSGTLIKSSEFGDNYWVPVEEAANNEAVSKQGSPAMSNLISTIAKKSLKTIKPFFIEEKTTIKSF